MDILEFGCIMTAIIMVGVVLLVHISSKNAIKMQELAEKQRISRERTKAAKARWEQPADDLAPWAAELMNTLGVSPEVLFEDEMPPELVKFMPMVKGFIQGGGLQKLLAGAQQQGPQEPDRASI